MRPALHTIKTRLAGSSERLDAVYASMLALAISLPAFLGNGHSFKPIFYALVLLPALGLMAVRQIKPEQVLRQCPAILLLLVPLLYWSLTNVWSEHPENVSAFLRRSFTLFVFLVAVAHLTLRLGPGLLRYLDVALLLAGIGAAIHLFGLVYMEPKGPNWRLGDATIFSRSLHASHYFGFFAVYGLVRFYQGGAIAGRLGSLLPAIFCLGFVVFTESRGTLISFLLVALLVCGVWYRRYLQSALIVLLAAVGGYFIQDVLVERGLSFRLEIWRGTWDIVQANFWGGIGLGTPLGVEYGGKFVAPHAHNLLYDLQARAGFFGMLVFLPIVALVLSRTLRAERDEQVYVAALVFFLLCVMTDVHKPINSPSSVYVIFWLPLAALLALRSGSAPENDLHTANHAGASS
ncbi:MAG: O-antigen ligase family protein [Halieaceae bacterium]